jgi:hypothetical protein
MPQASKYTENTELQKTEIDAAGIKTREKHGRELGQAFGSHGVLAPVTAIPSPCSFVFSAFLIPAASLSAQYHSVFSVYSVGRPFLVWRKETGLLKR